MKSLQDKFKYRIKSEVKKLLNLKENQMEKSYSLKILEERQHHYFYFVMKTPLNK